jgi:cytochrome c biogenesis protein CcmG, thiol:disulfide interchange protein DsbE
MGIRYLQVYGCPAVRVGFICCATPLPATDILHCHQKLLGSPMMSRVRHIHFILAAFLLLTAGCDRGSHPRQTGRVAPDFTVTDGNRSLRLADYRGRIVILNFWETSCLPCIAELPSLTAMQQQLPQVQVLAVSVDEDPQAYRDYLAEHKISLLTIDDTAHRSAALYGTYRWPETYVIDQHGVIRRKFIGAQDWTSPEIMEYLRRL